MKALPKSMELIRAGAAPIGGQQRPAPARVDEIVSDLIEAGVIGEDEIGVVRKADCATFDAVAPGSYRAGYDLAGWLDWSAATAEIIANATRADPLAITSILDREIQRRLTDLHIERNGDGG